MNNFELNNKLNPIQYIEYLKETKKNLKMQLDNIFNKPNDFVLLSTHDKYNVYKFNTCDHVQKISTGFLKRKGNCILCSQCIHEIYRKIRYYELQISANNVGLTYLYETKFVDHGIYRCNTCRSQFDATHGSVRGKKFKCCHKSDYCILKEIPLNIGLSLIENGSNNYYNVYKFNTCGHIQEIGNLNINYNNFVCNTCLQYNKEDKLECYDLTNHGGFDPTKPAWFYVLHYRTESNIDFIKYGITNRTIKQRSNEHIRNTKTKRIGVLQSIKFENGSIIQSLEQKCHELRKPDFSINPSDLESGHTEILPMDCLEEINKIIKELLSS